jgi:predicted Zn-dependent protease
VGVKFFERAYSRERELQADELGARLAVAAGFNEQGCFKLLSNLGQIKVSSAKSDIGRYFSTHPAFEERIRNIKNLKLK